MAGLTIDNAVSLVNAISSDRIIPGDTIMLRGGVYTLADMEIKWQGLAEAHITLTTYDNEPVIFAPSGYRTMLVYGSYIDIVGNMVFDGQNVESDCIKITNSGNIYPIGITLNGLELKNAGMNGVLVSGSETQATIKNIISHGHGSTKGDHGIYISDGTVLVEDCELYGNQGHGVHIYGGHSNAIVRRCYSHDNVNVGIGLYSDGALVYNNVCRNNNESGLRVRYGAISTELYFNTCIDNPNNIDIRAISNNNATVQACNNVCVGGSLGVYVQTSNVNLPEASIKLHNNLINGAAIQGILNEEANQSVVEELNNLTSAFSPVADNGAIYTPSIGNPAIGAGIAVAGITTDYAGNARANPPTIGAYE